MPGIIDEPGSLAGILISPNPDLGPEDKNLKSGLKKKVTNNSEGEEFKIAQSFDESELNNLSNSPSLEALSPEENVEESPGIPVESFPENNNQNTITSGITITATTFPDGGSQAETTESIKFAAPKFYSAFGRAVSTRDYEAIIPQIYPNVGSIACYGGEEAEPPEYGKVFLAIKPKNADKLSLSEKNVVLKRLREYSVAAIQPSIIDPSILYIDVDSFVYFNPNITRREASGVKNTVINSLTVLNNSGEFNKFGGKFKFSKLQSIIDSSETSITSNITRLKMRKNVTVDLGARVNYKICYGNRIKQGTSTKPTVISSGFKIVGDDFNTYYLNDDGASSLRLYYVKGTGEYEYVDGLWGTVDYSMGEIVINDLIISSTSVANNQLQISGTPESNDIISLRETYLTVGIDNTTVSVVEDTISSGSNISGTGVVPESSYS